MATPIRLAIKITYLMPVLLIVMTSLVSAVQAQTHFDAIRAQVQTQVQERQLHPPTPVPTPTPIPPSSGWWFLTTSSGAAEPVPVVKPVKPVPPDAVLFRIVGDLIVIRRVKGQVYLSVLSRR